MGTGTINSKRRYLESLKTKHRTLDDMIWRRVPRHNDLEIKQMKAEKLVLKTKISQLENKLNA